MTNKCIFICALTACVLAPRGQAATYIFTNIADNTTPGPIGTLMPSDPAISGGVVTFAAQYAGGTLEGVFMGSGGPLTTIAKEGDAAPSGVFTGMGNPSISSGRVVFTATYDDGNRGVFLADGGPLTTIAKTGDAAAVGTFTDFQDALIENDIVAFFGRSISVGGIYLSSGGTLTTIAKTGDLAPNGNPFAAVGRPAQSGGDVTFRATYGGNNGVFVGNGGPLTTIVKTGDPAPVGTFGGGDSPVIYNGNVAFRATYGSDEEGIVRGVFIGSGGPIDPIVLTGDPAPVGSFDEIGIPSYVADTMVFGAGFGGFHSGVFVRKNGILQPLLTDADVLFGSNIVIVGSARLDADGSGRIAFFYLLFDGRSGIAMATPVPEPGTIMLLAFGLGCSGLAFWR
ncbi:MAG: choice-of-anchor tandem repeat NxxGxxAF-containing protein [Pirellulales bacterium]